MAAARYFIYSFIIGAFIFITAPADAQKIMVAGKPAQLDIRPAARHGIRITLKPLSYRAAFPFSPSLSDYHYPPAVISLRNIDKSVKKKVGNLQVEIHREPLTITITNGTGEPVQEFIFGNDGKLLFRLDDKPVLGMGEGGPKPVRGTDWRSLPVQFDRRGQYDSMQPRWQSDAYGSRNPVAMLAGTGGWGIFVVSPWVQVDLRDKEQAAFIPWQPVVQQQQNQRNQQLNQGKGLPPSDSIVPGLYDFFVFDAHDPSWMMKDIALITGPAVLPPQWALGYMQSHRTLEDETQMIGIIDSFRAKKIPVDAVIYLGTGFTPRGWNTQQPSFDFNPAVFKREPAQVIADMHKLNVKVVLHIVPWDRDRLPTLYGTIPAAANEKVDSAHIKNYWQQHELLLQKGIDGFWPDEGDWFNLFERMKRHQLYYQGPVSTSPHTRPWSLHRNGYLGIAKWGGWVWSGDTESSWKTLEAQVSVGINHSLSLSPFWGSDIGGFYSNEELTGELYARWFQFGAFCASFRSHGRTWWTRLPWGWGLHDMGPHEQDKVPLQSEMDNAAIEPVCKKYAELRYQLLPYNYTLAWQTRQTGMPLMRALWLHYPGDRYALNTGNEYLWGRDLLIAPVFVKGAAYREVYLPEGKWYDWWTNTKETGGRTITRKVDLSTMPIYVRAGAIIPFDPIRQYTNEITNEPTTIKVYRGRDGDFTLYEDDGISLDYLKESNTVLTKFVWKDKLNTLTIAPAVAAAANKVNRSFKIELLPEGTTKEVRYAGKAITVKF